MIHLRPCLVLIVTGAMLPASSGCHHRAEPEAGQVAGSSSSTAKSFRTDSVGHGSVTVATVSPTRRDLVRKFEQPGQVEPAALADLYPKVAGYVKTVHCDIGDTVKADQVHHPALDLMPSYDEDPLAVREVRVHVEPALEVRFVPGVVGFVGHVRKMHPAGFRCQTTSRGLPPPSGRRGAASGRRARDTGWGGRR